MGDGGGKIKNLRSCKLPTTRTLARDVKYLDTTLGIKIQRETHNLHGVGINPIL